MLLYNTQTRSKEVFTPRVPGHVFMYVCGITAYDLCHIGHARSCVVFDVLVRHLRGQGLDVRFVRNFTDVDDKIINKANAEGLTSMEVAEKYIAAFHEDMDALGILRADEEPRATAYIGPMIELALRLIERGHAYQTASGDVYFRVRSFPGYGKLSGRDVEDLRSGARVAPGEEKEDPLDFALWKAAKPGEPMWPSPFGQGRPGWHLECSAMSEGLLDLPLDIHGGGQDLIFPHHENEIAQSEAALGREFCRFWVHNGFVRINTEKMSKSLGNFVTLRDIYAAYLPEVLRFFLVSAHYRSPLDYSNSAMDEAEKGIKRLYAAMESATQGLTRTKWSGAALPAEFSEELSRLEKGYAEAMDDDLNTAAALGHVFGMARLINRVLEDKALAKCKDTPDLLRRFLADMAGYAQVLGVFGTAPATFRAGLKASRLSRTGIDAAKVEALVAERQTARAGKDFARSDAIRDELAALGVEVKDTPAGPEWDVA
ncbi:cysteine--tRNA ligase [Desulfolutivibrio sulfoxidireducens]|uniref:cysteine--tRNA ligase n=1 Tax=Desulfolutivibrio sulfoxidireducens TaxID=2773299 RepID=UPI00159D270B|nr:cysteine--tRNA ligase [Desulfolutivibrio sulfoxidireducens]QLA20510.1 cysteine--tRNA ligase [Desulfolutivibrio sulfoxidireducens]